MKRSLIALAVAATLVAVDVQATVVPMRWTWKPAPAVVKPPVVAPAAAPKATPAPATSSSHNSWHSPGAAVFVGVAAYFITAIATNERCARFARASIQAGGRLGRKLDCHAHEAGPTSVDLREAMAIQP